MKRFFHMAILFAAIIVVFVSCKDNYDDSIVNLKVSITGETNAYATYSAFAKKAADENYRHIAAMFNAAAAAEGIHLKNHNDVLEKLGEQTFYPTAETPTVNGTEVNLRTASNVEKEEFMDMYPRFIATAKKENCKDAVASFRLAKMAEENHDTWFSEALSILKATESDKTVPSKWFVCARCGGIFTNYFSRCELCETVVDGKFYVPRVFDANL